MKTELYDLDKIININEPQLILIDRLDIIQDSFKDAYALLLNILSNIGIDQNIPSLLFSYFNDYNKLDIFSNRLEININRIEDTIIVKNILGPEYVRNPLTEEELKRMEQEETVLNNSNLFMEDFSNMNFKKLKEICIKMKEEKNIKIIGINNIEKIVKKNKFSLTVKKLSDLAKELNIPIIAVISEEEGPIEKNVSLEEYIKEISKIVKKSDIVIIPKLDEYSILNLIISKKNEKKVEFCELVYLKDYKKISNIYRPWDVE